MVLRYRLNSETSIHRMWTYIVTINLDSRNTHGFLVSTVHRRYRIDLHRWSDRHGRCRPPASDVGAASIQSLLHIAADLYFGLLRFSGKSSGGWKHYTVTCLSVSLAILSHHHWFLSEAVTDLKRDIRLFLSRLNKHVLASARDIFLTDHSKSVANPTAKIFPVKSYSGWSIQICFLLEQLADKQCVQFFCESQ